MPARTAIFLAILLTLASGGAARLVVALHPLTLLPWVGLSTLAVASTFRRPRSVDLFEPAAFLGWIHYAPVYVVGAFLLAVGVVGYPYAGLVHDAVASCVLSL
ncbi:MAG: hypothetical protein ABIT01_05985, partial [Thermoanaerobaculia bacterium]